MLQIHYKKLYYINNIYGFILTVYNINSLIIFHLKQFIILRLISINLYQYINNISFKFNNFIYNITYINMPITYYRN